MAKISIIVPVYNTAQYLSRCLDSIIGQTLEDVEILCVNDGSTDNSLDILKQYASKDKRIKIINKDNSGLVSTRKAGVIEAVGEYIGFVDSDDWIEKDMYNVLYLSAVRHDADIVSTDYIQDGNYSAVSRDTVDEGVYKGEGMNELRNAFILNLSAHDKGISGSLCTKIFRAKIMTKVLPMIPDEITVSEDKMTTLTFLLNCKSAVVLHEAFYHYVIHTSSMFHGENPNYLLNMHNVYKYLRSLYSEPLFTPEMRTQAELYIVQFLIKGINSRMGFSFRNLLWIDPYWIDEIEEGARVVLYGAGDLGRKYYQQLKFCNRFTFVGCIDYGFGNIRDEILEIHEPKWILDKAYDVIVITIKNRDKAYDIRKRLEADGIEADKIKWFVQEEIFWRFAEADGLLSEES